ncbi:unnamed protein product [Orchesella dallaii]|uniref:Uncharacterized protein n=1 Tax=Orchesella dallaii TaxID=48710 RepID=A0ABP1PK06_9HEXA
MSALDSRLVQSTVETENGENIVNDILLAELATEEIRAKRSLRALKHQETRISELENELKCNATFIEEIQENQIGLLGVHSCQKEVQDLQKQLIKLQEIQYLTEFSRVWNDSSSKHDIPKPEENFSTNSYSVYLNQGESKAVERKTCASSISKSNPSEEILTGKDKVGSHVSLDGRLSSFATLLEFIKRPVATASQNSAESKSVLTSRSNLKSQAKSQSQEYPASNGFDDPCDDNDDSKEMDVLRDTLNSHRASIECLSNEVTHLRNERDELVTYLDNIVEWKTDVEHSLTSVSAKPSPSNDKETTQIGVNSKTTSSEKSKKVRLSLRRSKEDIHQEKVELEEKAYKMWTAARKFFTPDQANFILTAPYPPGELESESSEGSVEEI